VRTYTVWLSGLFVLSCFAACSRADNPAQDASPGVGGAGGRGGTGGAAGSGSTAGAGGASPSPVDGSSGPDAVAAGPDAPAGDSPVDAEPPPGPLASCSTIVAAASAFIAGLEAPKRASAVLAFEARKHYQFTPEPTRPGLPLRDMSEAQQGRAFALLKASLSDSGYEKAMLIRTMDNWLKANVGMLPFGNLNYYVAIYGTPSADGTWAWHWEGHHASIHFTFVGCTRAASTPLMFGAEPARLAAAFEGVPAGTRVLGKQEDIARSLATMLAADPAKKAIALPPNGGRMLPNTPAKQGPLNPPGLPVAKMNPAEADKVKELLAEVVGNVNPELAGLRMQKVQAAGLDKVSFLWVGPLTVSPNSIYYFRLQGPSFIFEHNIEWENHVHSAWRDFDGDFGEDLLQKHLKQFPHQSASLYAD
jgi:hypothetical protein